MNIATEVAKIQGQEKQNNVVNDTIIDQIKMAETVKQMLSSIGHPINPIFNISLLSRTEHHCTNQCK